METKIKWNEGEGYITATYEGSGNGSASISSDVNEGIDREQPIKVETTDKSLSATLLVTQEGLREVFFCADGGFILADGGTFNVLKGGGDIPVETYTLLTYIECTGEQYIDLGYVVQEDDVIEMDYISTSSTSDEKALFGAYDSNGSIWYLLYSNTAYIRYGSSTSVSKSNARQKYLVKLQKGSVDIDGDSATLTYEQMPTSSLYLFARNHNNNSVEMYGYCKSSGFRITKKTGEVVMSLKPCKRDSDGAIGMLDNVSGQFFMNRGTGADFIAGNEIKIPQEYEVLEYVTFSKNILYDLGIISSTDRIEVMFARNETTSTTYMYGIVTSPHTASVTAYLSSGGAWRFGTSYKGVSMTDKRVHRVEVYNGKIIYDFTTGAFTKATFTTPDTVVLGGYRTASGSLSKTYQGKIYYFRIYNNGELRLDWYPCKRLSDGMEGFWDCVTQRFIEPI